MSTNLHNFASKDDIQQQACDWVAKLDRGIKEDECQALYLWCQQSQFHRDTLEEMAALWDDMSIMNSLQQALQQPPGPSTSVKHRWWTGMAAALVLSVSLMFALQYGKSADVISPTSSHYATAIGEQSVVELADGSRVRLNTATRLSVDFKDNQRSLTLLAGEAHFDVANDPTRPFVVSVGDTAFTAIGTAFSVHRAEGHTELLVTEGIVGLDAPRIAADSRPKFTAGQQAMVDTEARVTERTLSADELARTTAWQHGMLMFAGETLKEVLAEIGRYHNLAFEFDDPALQQQRVAGSFKTGDVQGLLATLRQHFGIQSYRRSPTILVLSKSAENPAESPTGSTGNSQT